MNRAILALALALPACAANPALNLQAAVAAEEGASCPTSNEGKARLYGARALFDRTVREGLSPDQQVELETARVATDERCGLASVSHW